MSSADGFECSQCFKSFKQKQHLNRHVKAVHNQNLPFKCKVCDAKFALKEHWKRHHIAKHPKQPIALKKGQKAVKLSIKKYECSKCDNSSFTSNWELIRHTRFCHSNDLNCPLCKPPMDHMQESTVFDVQHCDHVVMFESRTSWISHMDWHRGVKPFLCPCCLGGFVTKQSLKTHVISKHDKMPSLKCLHCHEKFSHRNQIVRHMSNLHAVEEGTYQCVVCLHDLLHTEVLDHYRTWHPVQKTKLCVYCFMTFDTYSQCQNHVNTVHYCKIDESEINKVTNEDEEESTSKQESSDLDCRILLRIHVDKKCVQPLKQLNLHPLLPNHLKEAFPHLHKLQVEMCCSPGTTILLQIPLKMNANIDDVSNELLLTLSRPLDLEYKG